MVRVPPPRLLWIYVLLAGGGAQEKGSCCLSSEIVCKAECLKIAERHLQFGVYSYMCSWNTVGVGVCDGRERCDKAVWYTAVRGSREKNSRMLSKSPREIRFLVHTN